MSGTRTESFYSPKEKPLTPSMAAILSEMQRYGELVREGGGLWRAIGENGHSNNVFNCQSLHWLVYRGLIEAVIEHSDPITRRPNVYRLVKETE